MLKINKYYNKTLAPLLFSFPASPLKTLFHLTSFHCSKELWEMAIRYVTDCFWKGSSNLHHCPESYLLFPQKHLLHWWPVELMFPWRVSSIYSLRFNKGAHLLCFWCFNLPPLVKVTLISYDILESFFINILLNFLKPVLHIVVWLAIAHIIDNDDPISSPIVTTRDSFETILPCGIPLLY